MGRHERAGRSRGAGRLLLRRGKRLERPRPRQIPVGSVTGRYQAALLTDDAAKIDQACEPSSNRGRLEERVAMVQGQAPEPQKYQYRVNP